jgi:hypothetical protein
MIFLLITVAVLVLVLTGPGLLKLDAHRNHVRMLNANWLSTEDKFRIIARWGAQY